MSRERIFVLRRPEMDGFLDSALNVKVFPGLTIATVFKGKLTIKRPRYLVLTRNQQASIRKTAVQEVRSLSRRELDQVIEWRQMRPRDDQFGSKKEKCREYAGLALKQNQENIQRRCGFSGPRWSSDFNGHYQWCLKVPQEFAESETRARREALQQKCTQHIIK